MLSDHFDDDILAPAVAPAYPPALLELLRKWTAPAEAPRSGKEQT